MKHVIYHFLTCSVSRQCLYLGCLENADLENVDHRPRKRRPCKQIPRKHRRVTNTKTAFSHKRNEFKSLSSAFLFLFEVCVFEVCGLHFRDTLIFGIFSHCPRHLRFYDDYSEKEIMGSSQAQRSQKKKQYYFKA